MYWWGGPCNCTVEVTGDGGITWHDISPWVNPIARSQGKRYTIDISAYIGTQTAVRFTYSGQYSWLYFWAIDDVIMFDQIVEYNQSYYTDVPAWTIINITLPDWTPADLNVSDDVTLEYIVNATTENYGRPNFYKQKTFTLYFGYVHDVAITAINSPQSGLPLTQPCQVVLENDGLNAESVNVSMQIGKIQYSQWTQEESTEWQQSNSNAAGGTAPEAYLPYYSITGDYAYLMSCPIDTSALPTLTLSFRSMINNYAGGYNCSVKSRSSEADPWARCQPMGKPDQRKPSCSTIHYRHHW